MKQKLLLLNNNDNVLICCQKIQIDELIKINEQFYKISTRIDVGHKISNECIKKGQKIIRYGVSIGSATADIKTGEHVHLHNMKSDYIPSHTRQAVIGE